MDMSENINELAAALSKAQAAIESAVATRENPFFKSTYANLSDVWDACRKPLTDNGLSIIQTPQISESSHEPVLVTRLLHSSGQWVRAVYPLKPVKGDPQSLGACVTYARRFSLAALVGVSSTEQDDDGNVASARNEQQKTTKAPKLQESQVGPNASYMIKTGSHVGKTLGDLGLAKSREWLNQIIDREKVAGKPLPPEWSELARELTLFTGKDTLQ